MEAREPVQKLHDPRRRLQAQASITSVRLHASLSSLFASPLTNASRSGLIGVAIFTFYATVFATAAGGNWQAPSRPMDLTCRRICALARREWERVLAAHDRQNINEHGVVER